MENFDAYSEGIRETHPAKEKSSASKQVAIEDLDFASGANPFANDVDGTR